MTYVAFYEYFANVYNEQLKEKKVRKPVVVFLDGYVSHMSYNLSSFRKANRIILVCLPPNASQILQRLDVSVFAPLKRFWTKFLRLWRIDHNGAELEEFDIPAALSKIITQEDFKDTIKAGFKCCGLYPFGPNGIIHDKCVKRTNSSN